MKKVLAMILAMIMVASLVSCGGKETEQIKETKQAQETSQVQETKQVSPGLSEEEREAIYARALEFDEANEIDLAYETYCQLPDLYRDVKKKKEVLKQYVGICGFWECSVEYEKATDGEEYRPLYTEIEISVDKRYADGGCSFKFETTLTNYDSKSVLYNKVDFPSVAFELLEGGFTISKVESDGTRTTEEMHRLSWGSLALYEQFSFSDDGKLTVKTAIPESGLDVSFPYSMT